ncbi:MULTISPECIES: ABC transporter ATP-binding protein [unclassified Thermosynechococcus]|uniref:ABC transporter ATP-binding protein n=1 Tax=unclassified Thermosynechococcus TaxID=2622553 RepID=UPI001A09FD55|nr:MULTISPECIES: ABC transporter ATP-binding protein [unclassified Thermosynechococcus]HIK34425.1 ABC transporter ATP-binding protein [Thermosynechococcus sp. M98_K2018_005]HIK47558.1 ABC transporter ATP-binding protein [Thermosynechococcus sp. M55_K2018_012]
MTSRARILEIESLSVHYSGICALRAVSLAIEAGECITLLGANGAGKTTLLRAISKLVPSEGIIRFAGQSIAGRSPHELVRLGIAHCPEGREVLARQTVRDNLLLGAYCCRDKAQITQNLEEQLKRFPRLRERQHQLAGTLSGGEQQMLAIARALMSRPRLLLLDEPSLGLAPNLVREIFAILAQLRQQGMTMLLVEQNAHLALQLGDRGYVLEAGQVTLSGSAAELLNDPRVQQAYLG